MKAEDRSNVLRITVLILAILGVTVGHFVVGTTTHPLHIVHVFLRCLYLLIIIASAVWYGLKGGIVSALLISILFGSHVLISWAGNSMENVNQAAMIGVYLILGSVAGLLVEFQNKEREARLETERRAEREAVIQGFASLSHALNARDEYTRKHSENVAQLAVRIGRRRGIGDAELEDLRLAALVHDIGKIGVRDDILFKEDRFSPEERERMERHPEIAAEILRAIKGASRIADIVLAHHECPDGSGYPRGLRNGEIPVEAEILSVADVYCALTEERPYKKAEQPEKALEIIHRMAGRKLDPETILALEETLGEQGGSS